MQTDAQLNTMLYKYRVELNDQEKIDTECTKVCRKFRYRKEKLNVSA